MNHLLWALGIVVGVIFLLAVIFIGGLLWQTRDGKWNN